MVCNFPYMAETLVCNLGFMRCSGGRFFRLQVDCS